MVMIDVVLGPSGVAVQALVSLLMMVLMFFATLHFRPFAAPHIGRLGLYSLSTSFMTLWMGSFFWASKNKTGSTYISVLIVLINVVFLLFLVVTLVGDVFHDYEVVKKAKFFGRRAGHRASSLRRTFSSSKNIRRTFSSSKNITWWSSNREEEEEVEVVQANTPSLPDINVPWSGEIKTSDNPLTTTKKNKKKKAKEVELMSMKKVKKTSVVVDEHVDEIKVEIVVQPTTDNE